MGSKRENHFEPLSESDSETEHFPEPRKSKASPRPKSGKQASGSRRKGRPGSASGGAYPASTSGKNARDLWLGTVQSGTGTPRNKKGHVGSRSATEAWTHTLRRTGVGITSETGVHNMDTFTGLSKSQSKGMSYASTSHYLRQMAGTEKTGGGGATRKNGMSDTATPRSSAGRPAYKSQEEYYDEIIELKKQIQTLNKDNSTIRLKARRVEEDNIKKEKQIEQLLDPTKSEEMRRTLGDRKPDTASVIHSLKTKILKLEHQLKDREAAYSKLQSDLKTTKVEEMKVQTEAFYQEIKRLREMKTVDAAEKPKKPIKETPSRLKAMQETVLRMNEKNVRLQAENKSLKQDLDKLMAEMGMTKEKQDHYEDMTKKELLGAIGKLEKRLDKAEESTSLISDVEARNTNTEGKITLEGTVAQRLDQLDKRETELLEEMKKKNTINKRLKDDRTHYRKKNEDKQKEIERLKKEIEELQAEIDGFYDRDKNTPTPRANTPRSARRQQQPSPRSTTPRRQSSASSGSDRQKVEKFRQNHAAKTIQKQWRGHKDDAREREREREREEIKARHQRDVQQFTERHAAKVIQRSWRHHQKEAVEQEELRHERDRRLREFSENRAAKTIQREWIGHKSRQMNREDEEAAELLQSAMRNHRYRKTNLHQWQDEEDSDDMTADQTDTLDDDSDLDSAASVIQSQFRGYKEQKGFIRSTQPPKPQPRHNVPVKNDDEDIMKLQSALRNHLENKKLLANESSYNISRNSPQRNRPVHKGRALDSEGEDLDEDSSSPAETPSRRFSGSFSKQQRTRTPSPRIGAKSPAPSLRSSRGRRTPVPLSTDDDESDDDIQIGGGSKKYF